MKSGLVFMFLGVVVITACLLFLQMRITPNSSSYHYHSTTATPHTKDSPFTLNHPQQHTTTSTTSTTSTTTSAIRDRIRSRREAQRLRPETQASCRRGADWVDTCQYTQLCIDHENIYMLTPDLSMHDAEIDKPQGVLSSFDNVHLDPAIYPPVSAYLIPQGNHYLGRYIYTNQIAPPIGHGKIKITWLEGMTYIVYPDVAETNLWHWAVSWFPIAGIRKVALGWASENPYEDQYVWL
eukprot:TRINITY_DN6827_c1_g1_i1.p2 TRINITY_DN6827_c1_g1~~TRINITY_DN6827_c1_g1_i1.p2  ORF type:complete len:238 (+),score=42.62 TRINITY_DN6827_c1_g1_i1:31-744(+)